MCLEELRGGLIHGCLHAFVGRRGRGGGEDAF